MSRVLVTGGAGFIGSHLVDKLKNNGHTVIILDDFSGGTMNNLSSREGVYWADCRDEYVIDKIFHDEKPEIVYHLAANAAENKAQFSPIDITSRNYDAFIKILTPFIKYGGKRFVFTSSIAVYGALQTPFKETDKPEPEDLYGITKLAAEETLKVMSKVHDFEYVVTRPHNVYGPRQNMRDPYRNLITIWMNKILKGEKLPIYGDGEQVRQFSYIDDVIYQLYKCGFEDVSGMIFNLGSNDSCTVNEMARKIELITGKYTGVEYFPYRPQEVKIAVADHSVAEICLGSHKTDIDSAIQETWLWCERQGSQIPLYTKLEIESNKVPSNWL